MSRKYKKLSDEERRRLAHSQMLSSAQELLKHSSILADKLKFGLAVLTKESPIAIVVIKNELISITFMYGPNEFHVALFLTHKNYPNICLGLSELYQNKKIKEWAINNRPVIINNENRIESEVNWYGNLLLEACTEIFTSPDSFFDRWANPAT